MTRDDFDRLRNQEVTDFSGADLHGVNFTNLGLDGLNFKGTNLSGCIFNGVNLNKCDFENADLSGAILNYALLRNTNLTNARLDNVNISGVDLFGDSPYGSGIICAYSMHDRKFEYELGKEVSVDNFDEDRRHECAPGIHFFMTREEAVNYVI
jgi:hypothetical protein